MRILFMADVSPNPDSGAAGTELRTIEALRELGHEVDALWSSDFPRRIAHGNLHYLLELPRAYRSALVRLCENRVYDVAHVNQPHGFLAARHLSGRPHRPVFVHRSHGLEMHVQEERRRWKRRLAHAAPPWPRTLASEIMSGLLDRHSRAIARWADGHIVSSSLDARYLTERLFVPMERIAIIPQAPPQFFQDATPPAMTASRLKKVLYAGQFDFIKAPVIVAAVMRALADDRENSMTWVTAARDHPQVRELLGEAAGRVQLLDWLPAESLQAVYDAHGVFLFPSFFEGFGKAFLEAMSRGLVVVASDVGGAHDVITSGHDGFLAPAGEVERLVSIVRTLMNHPEQAALISSAAVQSASRYRWSRVAEETAEFYRRLIDRRSAGGMRP